MLQPVTGSQVKGHADAMQIIACGGEHVWGDVLCIIPRLAPHNPCHTMPQQ
jgi:hypothetical protein